MQSTTHTGNELTFLDYLRPIWRFKVLVVLVVAVAAAGAYYITDRQPRTYEASTSLYVGPSSIQQALNPTAGTSTVRQVADQAQLITSLSVATAVRADLKLPSPPGALLGAVQVTPNANADFLTISAQSGDPSLSAKLANGFARAYLQRAQANLLGGAKAALAATEGQLHRKGLSQANRLALGTELATIEGVIVSPPSVGQQLSPATVPAAPVSPKPTRNAIFAAVLALVLCVILAYILDRNDRRVRRLDEVEDAFELPVLVSVPHARRRERANGAPDGVPVVLREPYRSLRVNLEVARAEHNGKIVMVTSALPSEGKSTVVRNLAIVYREAGARVAILEADLRRPVLGAQLKIAKSPGLSEALAAGGDLPVQRAPDGSQHVNGSGGVIDVVVAGAATYDPTALLTNRRLPGFIQRLAADHDLVLIDSPPLLSVSDGLPLLGLVDGVLLVVRGGTATRPAAERLRRTLDRVSSNGRVRVFGIVANHVTDELASYYRFDRQREAAASPSLTADQTAS